MKLVNSSDLTNSNSTSRLPPIPAKKYFTIGEVSDLCRVKPHVLRYWEQEFQNLKPIKRRGNRRYYQHNDVLIARHIRSLLYEHGFTINGAKQKLLTPEEANSAEQQLELSNIEQIRVTLNAALSTLKNNP